MRKIIFLTIVILIVATGVFFYIDQINAPSHRGQNDFVNLSWIEVFSPGVFIRYGDEVQGKELQSGDQIEAPAAVTTGLRGIADLHMSDGSVIRMDASTEINLQEVIFDARNNSLKIKVTLISGRVWFKITEVSASDSYWELKTNNATMVAQGAAFGAEYIQGKTFVIAAENKVTVAIVDPQSGKPLANKTAIVPAGRVMEIYDADIEGLLKGKKILNSLVRDAWPEIWVEPWVERAMEEDVLINHKINNLKSGGLNDQEIRGSLTKENIREMQKRSADN